MAEDVSKRIKRFVAGHVEKAGNRVYCLYRKRLESAWMEREGNKRFRSIR